MPDLQSTVEIQRYLVVEEGHGILGYFELPDDECIRDEVREIMSSRYEDDAIAFLRDPDAASGAADGPDRAIFAYAIPDSVPEFDPEDHELSLDYDWTTDSLGLGDTTKFSREEAFLRVTVDGRGDGLVVIDPFPGNDGKHSIDASGTARVVTARIAEALPQLDDESCKLLARLAKKSYRPAEATMSRVSLIDVFYLEI